MATNGKWIAARLGECGELRNGVNFNQTQEGTGLPVLKVKDFGDLVLMPVDGLDELNPREITIPRDQYLSDGDVVIIRSNGNGQLVGRSLLVRGLSRPTTFSGFSIRFRPDVRRIDPRYSAYFIRSPICRQRFTAFGSGTGIQNLNQATISDVEIDLPPLDEQKAIARVLGVLDDKIEMNRRMNQTLEGLARALFRSWFVDFDPVVAKAAGKKPVGMSAQTAAFFPDRFQDSAVGPIPKGWSIGRIRDLCEPQYGYTTSAKPDGDGPKLLRVTDMNKEPWIEWSDVPACTVDERQYAKYRLRPGDVLVSRMADPGKAAIVEENVDSVFASYLIRLNRHVESDAYFLFYTLRSDNYLAYAEGATGGTVQANMNAQVITAAEVVTPPVPVRQRFSDAVSPLRQKLVGNLQQKRSLAALRDALLPQLMSGALRVGDAEALAEDALA